MGTRTVRRQVDTGEVPSSRPLRAYGSGSIKKVRDGVYRLRVRSGVDSVTGRSRWVTETYEGSWTAAQRRLAALVARHGGRGRATSGTFGQLLEEWSQAARIARATRSNYERAMARIPDRVKSVAVDRLSAHELDMLYRDLMKHGVGADAVRQVHAVASAALTRAVAWGWVPYNVARAATPPSKPRSKASAPPADALSRLLAVADDQQTRLWLRLVASTGARRAEVLALRWRDIDVDACVVTVRGALETDGTPKATKSERWRDLPIGPALADDLRVWRLAARERAMAAGVHVADTGYVLSDEVDCSKPWVPASISKKFYRLAHKAALTGVRLHDMRHGAVTDWLADGVSVVDAAALAGHASASTTVNMYGHAIPAAQRAAVERREARLAAV